MTINGEASAALTDVHSDVVWVRLVTTGPREAWRQTQYLVVLWAQRVLLLPAVHSRVDHCHLVLRVEQYILAALVGRVDELEGKSSRCHDGDVGQVAVPILVSLKMTLVDARLRCRPDCRRRGRWSAGALPRSTDADKRRRQQYGADDRKRLAYRETTAHAR